MAQRLNESVYKAEEEAQAQEMRQKIEADLTAKPTAQFNNEWNQRKAFLKKEFTVEKTAMKRTISKVQKVSKKKWNFISSQAAASSSEPPPLDHNEDDDNDGTPNLGDDTQP